MAKIEDVCLWAELNNFQIEEDNNGQVIIYTGMDRNGVTMEKKEERQKRISLKDPKNRKSLRGYFNP